MSGRNLHVLLACSSLGVGGSETYTLQLARSLLDLGDRVTVAYGKYYANPLVEQLDERAGRLELPVRSTHGARHNHLSNFFLSVPVVVRHCVTARVSIVHTVLPSIGLPVWVGGRMAGVPALHTPMSTASVAGELARRLYASPVSQHLLTNHIALSDYLASDLVEHAGVPASMIRTCRLGVDIHRFRPVATGDPLEFIEDGRSSTSRRWVGVCARLEPDKDVERAIRAFASMDATPDAHLAIVGDGSQRTMLETLVRQLGIRDRTHFLGIRTDIENVLRRFDVGVQTTRGPNLGLATLEMLASGVPVVIAARDAEEIRMAEDTLCGGGGGAVADAAPKELAKALEEVLLAPEHERLELRQRARSTAEEHYSWPEHVQSVRRVYLEALERSQR